MAAPYASIGTSAATGRLCLAMIVERPVLGRVKQIREPIASFFRTFAQDNVHDVCLPENFATPYSSNSIRPGAEGKGDRVNEEAINGESAKSVMIL